jgi:TRAP-type C4-dicarboxylate transport system permease small subunit
MRHVLNVFVHRVSSVFSLIGSLGIFLMLLHVTADVASRMLFNYPPPATVLVVSHYYMVMIAFFPLGWSELRGDMISVEVLSWMFKGKLRLLKTLIIELVMLLVYSFLAVTTWNIAVSEFAVRSYKVSLSVAVPIWPSYFILPAAFLVAAIVVAIRTYLYFFPDPSEQFSKNGPDSDKELTL